METELIITKNKAGRYYWKLRNYGNHKTLCWSEGYYNLADCQHCAQEALGLRTAPTRMFHWYARDEQTIVLYVEELL